MADTKILFGILGVMILTTGTVFLLTEDQLKNTYVCSTNNVTGIFEKLSATNKTVYWTDELGEQKQSVCTKGTWIQINTWCEQNKLDCQLFLDKGINIDEDINKTGVEEVSFDEEGNTLITKNITEIIVTKDVTLNSEGKIIQIKYQPVIKCICDKQTGCLIKECIE